MLIQGHSDIFLNCQLSSCYCKPMSTWPSWRQWHTVDSRSSPCPSATPDAVQRGQSPASTAQVLQSQMLDFVFVYIEHLEAFVESFLQLIKVLVNGSPALQQGGIRCPHQVPYFLFIFFLNGILLNISTKAKTFKIHQASRIHQDQFAVNMALCVTFCHKQNLKSWFLYMLYSSKLIQYLPSASLRNLLRFTNTNWIKCCFSFPESLCLNK